MTELTVNRRMNRGEWLALLLLSVFWGGSFFFAGVQVKALPPLTIISLRVGLAAIILNVLLTVLGNPMLRRPGARFSAWAFSTTRFPFASWSGARAPSLPGSRRS
jgi:drug/metabolite transporter (DMT)-like permease